MTSPYRDQPTKTPRHVPPMAIGWAERTIDAATVMSIAVTIAMCVGAMVALAFVCLVMVLR